MLDIFRQLPTKAKATVAILLLIIVAAAAGYGLYGQVVKAGKVGVTVHAAPSDATIKVNGITTSVGMVYLEPDKTYTFTASREGFEPQTASKYITTTDKDVFFVLVAVSDEAKKWAQNNLDEYMQLEGKAGEEANDQGIRFAEKNPITKHIPIQNLIYTIGYKSDPSDPTDMSIIITIDAARGYRNGALQAIRDLGYDPTQYKIEFKDYENPFAS